MEKAKRPRPDNTSLPKRCAELPQQARHHRKIPEYRGLKKLLSTHMDALHQLINPRTGRIHTSFNQAVTATGRLQLQQSQPAEHPHPRRRRKEIRKAFIPDTGCEFFSADYSQIELRIMAHLSEDKNMIDASARHDHATAAAKIYKIDINDVTADMRCRQKRQTSASSTASPPSGLPNAWRSPPRSQRAG